MRDSSRAGFRNCERRTNRTRNRRKRINVTRERSGKIRGADSERPLFAKCMRVGHARYVEHPSPWRSPVQLDQGVELSKSQCADRISQCRLGWSLHTNRCRAFIKGAMVRVCRGSDSIGKRQGKGYSTSLPQCERTHPAETRINPPMRLPIELQSAPVRFRWDIY